MADTVRSITGVFNGIPGMFTCAEGVICGDQFTTTPNVGGQRVLVANLGIGWTFESDDYVESAAAQGDYMYFGYWLQSPVNSSDDPMSYEFGVIVGGSTKFALHDDLKDGDETDYDEALTATYEGGAAGRYVTRKLRIKEQEVDSQSPGYHGRFTAKARLTANFGMHEDFDGDSTVTPVILATPNSIQGSITDIKDGTTDLGFGVITLKRTGIGSDGEIEGAEGTSATANFGETATNTGAKGTGTWSAQFYGPSADNLNAALRSANPGVAETDLNLADNESTLPTGVAGQFNVSSNTGHTRVVGAFAAEKK